MVFLRLGIVLGIGFGHSFWVCAKTKRDKKAGLGIVLGIVFGSFYVVCWGGVMHVKYAFLGVFLVFVGGGITVLLSWSLSVMRCKSMK